MKPQNDKITPSVVTQTRVILPLVPRTPALPARLTTVTAVLQSSTTAMTTWLLAKRRGALVLREERSECSSG
ncbi:uncharacterized protein LOC144871590 isoform X4 [Branchiostoma floridae x Branchiostoma japonicum]